jgi:hypothetical protein
MHQLAIEWDALVAEIVLFAVLIYGAVCLERWMENRKVRMQDDKSRRQVIRFVTDDLNSRLRFIAESIQYRDFKPFFTDMWDSVILGGKQTLLPFPLFENLQHTYSWMKYYNNELDQKGRAVDEKEALELLGEVKKSIKSSLKMLEESNLGGPAK